MTNSVPQSQPPRAAPNRNRPMGWRLALFVLAMFGFGYALVPMYKVMCEVLGINVLSRTEVGAAYDNNAAQAEPSRHTNTQVDWSRTVTVEFDANARGPWQFRPAQAAVTVHPGQMTTVLYEFRNTQARTMTAQAIPSYAPGQAQAHFNKVECFCFTEHTLQPGESRQWPVMFYVDSKLPKDVKTITLSYTFFEVGGKTPPAPAGAPV